MKTQLFAPLVIAVLAASINANAVTNKPPHSRTIVVQSPSDMPVLAQANSEATELPSILSRQLLDRVLQ